MTEGDDEIGVEIGIEPKFSEIGVEPKFSFVNLEIRVEPKFSFVNLSRGPTEVFLNKRKLRFDP